MITISKIVNYIVIIIVLIVVVLFFTGSFSTLMTGISDTFDKFIGKEVERQPTEDESNAQFNYFVKSYNECGKNDNIKCRCKITFTQIGNKEIHLVEKDNKIIATLDTSNQQEISQDHIYIDDGNHNLVPLSSKLDGSKQLVILKKEDNFVLEAYKAGTGFKELLPSPGIKYDPRVNLFGILKDGAKRGIYIPSFTFWPYYSVDKKNPLPDCKS